MIHNVIELTKSCLGDSERRVDLYLSLVKGG